jgi:thiosulfate/3-mercaptopyruvate sulfurtransferase
MSPLVTPEQLARELTASQPPLLLDVRAVENYCENHLAGAVHLDLFGISTIDTDPAPLRSFFWIIEHLFASRGVSNEVPIVVYDDTSGIRAARGFWFLEFFGHPNTRVLDGGFNAWIRNGLPVTRQPQRPKPTDWIGTRNQDVLAGWRDVKERLHRDDVVIVDTRSDGEYYGTIVRAARGGAVPGAVHVEWSNNLTTDGSFKSTEDLQNMYARAGITPDHEIVTYCQGGYRAAHSYLALRVLGYPRVRNYIGSWKEWGDRPDLPIEHPVAPGEQ